MCERLKKLNELGFGFFEKVSDTEFKSASADAMVLTKTEFEEKVKEGIKMEIPYLSNEKLKPYLPEMFQSDIILNDYKEMSKYDHTLLSSRISDEDLFFYDVIGDMENIADLVLGDSGIVSDYDDMFVILISELEKENN